MSLALLDSPFRELFVEAALISQPHPSLSHLGRHLPLQRHSRLLEAVTTL